MGGMAPNTRVISLRWLLGIKLMGKKDIYCLAGILLIIYTNFPVPTALWREGK